MVIVLGLVGLLGSEVYGSGSLVSTRRRSHPPPHWTRPPYMGGGRTQARTSSYLGHVRGAARLGRGGDTLGAPFPLPTRGFLCGLFCSGCSGQYKLVSSACACSEARAESRDKR